MSHHHPIDDLHKAMQAAAENYSMAKYHAHIVHDELSLRVKAEIEA